MPRPFLAAILLLSSCAVSHAIQLRPDARPAAGESAAVGRIELSWEVPAPEGVSYPSVLLALVREGDAEVEAEGHEVGDGAVRWRLAPGRYQITAWRAQEVDRWGVMRQAWRSGPVGVAFEVQPAGTVTYLGTLRLGLGRQAPRIEVADAQESELQACQALLPAGAPVKKSLFRTLEPEPAVEASRGAELPPPVVKALFPNPAYGVANELQPTLRWELLPGLDPAGATFDLRISRAVWLAGADLFGPEIYRRERLASPSHRVEQPLEWDRYYYWEVRVRRGEEVGPWARHDAVLMSGTRRNIPFVFKVNKPVF